MSHPSIRPWTGVLAALGLLLVGQQALPLTTAAQQVLPEPRTDAPLQGVVVDESTGQPVDAATLSLVGTDLETQIGRYGGFAFPDVPLGMVAVRVTAPGHPSVVQEVEVKPDGIVFVRFLLPSVAAVLSELLVTVSPEEPTAGLFTAADLLAIEVPASRVVPGDVGDAHYPVRLRGSATTFMEDAGPLVLVDGVVISGHGGRGMEALQQIPASEVEDIQVLRGPAATFLYPLAADGVVLVKTRRGSGRR